MSTRALVPLLTLLAACEVAPEAAAPDAGSALPGPVEAGAPPPSADAGAPPTDAGSPPPRLHVQGATLALPSGGPIVLRGFNWGQWGLAEPQDAKDNREQGANSVRIPLRWWGDWQGEVDSRDDAAPGHISPAALATLDQTIAWATAQGLWVVLFVDSNYGQAAHGSTDNFWTNPTKKAEFLEVWKFLLRRYAQTPYIAAWELLPEPQLEGPTADADVKAFYDSLIPELRAIDPRTPFVVGPTNAYDLHRLEASYTTIDPQIVYTGDYFIFDKELNRMPSIESFVKAHAAPVWVNQVGIPSGNADALAKAERVLAALDAANVGWSWWTYRVHSTNPDTHGIWYEDPSDTSKWLLKPDWLALVTKHLRAP